MDDDRDILINALESAVRAYGEKTTGATLLGRPAPDSAVLDPVSAAIEKCAAFKLVADHVLFIAGYGVVLQSIGLALPLVYRAEQNIIDAAEWLLRVLTTRHTKGIFKAAIWGISIDEEVLLQDSSRLVPFALLPDSHMKNKVIGWAKPQLAESAWLSHNYFGVPRAAFIREVTNFPCIYANNSSFDVFDRLEQEARECWVLIEAASIGHPLVFGFWFEYSNQDADYNPWQISMSWSMPEIVPLISRFISANPNDIKADLHAYKALPPEIQSDLRRSMKRFTLSQCRHQIIDRVLDLVLAFEIAVSGGGGNQPISWKVSVRSAQLIGGALEERQNNRDKINDLFKLRNKATHGSSLKANEIEEQKQLIQQCSDIYRILVRSFLAFGKKPDWKSLELEPRQIA
jgi:Apea-like HEPN